MRLPFVLAALLTASTALAQAPSPTEPLPATVAWADVISLIHTRSPRLQAVRSQGQVAERDIKVAGVLPNPSLNYTGFALLQGSTQQQFGTQHQIGLEWPILIGGQRSARVRAARRRAEVTHAEIAVSEAELERDALHAFIGLLAAQARLDELSRAHADIDNVSHTVHERVAAGAEAQYDASRVELESAQLDTHVAQTRAEVTESSAELAATLGFPGWQPRASGAFAAMGVAGNFDTLWGGAQGKLPALVAAERRSSAAESEIEVARSERWGEPTIQGGSLLTTAHNTSSVFLGFSFPLPVMSFGGAAIDRANAGLSAAHAESFAARAQAEASLRGALGGLEARQAALETFDHGVGDRLPGLREMAENAYRSGTASLLELLDSVRSAIEVRLTRIDIVSEVLNAEVDVMVAAGTLHATAAAATPPRP